ncbi:MAG TPA: tRNA (guanosine(46)-N7)-methyltransferase TrmB [bacterium]|nr:tRNA (guanosine(46)-N7)-methyltransferase TrmB [bacterium]HQI47581.1 tRNA (guanosine(46)-N7)-methyltransferase TrmB [bacterium]HQJ64359.1 tRNA (guanosine(46)-N7)-methyltransferase TrmB [bacterium]HQJ65471.1 tRNA (guanosine(46)-N7)-methyltransferase TrmB [bacterium]
MAKQKLIRFAALPGLANVRQDPGSLRGHWHSDFFHNDRPITLELACGKGDYTLALAQRYPERNFIGIDIKGPRLWVGATRALELGLTNAGFVRASIEQLGEYFAPGEIAVIWITFPDPHPAGGKHKKRLTSTRFLDLYQLLLQPDGLLHLKTDDEGLYAFTLRILARRKAEVLASTPDLYSGPSDPDLTGIQTAYEQRHIKEGKRIKYIRFRLKAGRD